MKKIIYIAIIAISSINCKAQLTIVPLQNKIPGGAAHNEYLMDTELFLNQFTGTWLYTNGTTSLKFVLRKEVNNYNGYYHEDVIYGEYQYIENDIEKINTLNQIDIVYQAQRKHSIGGNDILNKNERAPCNDCEENEKKLLVILSDPIKDIGATVILRRVTINNEPALSALIHFDGIKETGATLDDLVREFVGSTIPNGKYFLIKQP